MTTPAAGAARLRKRQQAGVINRTLSWVLLVVLVAADATYRLSSEDEALRDLAWVLQIAMILLLFIHAGLSFYVFGRVPFRRTLRVFHIYFGYFLLAVVLVSQTTFGWEPWHAVFTVIMYLCIAAHIALGIKFSSRRRAAAR